MISAFTIIKDEAKYLQRMFDNLKGYVDEFVVINQEREDNSVELCKQNGARIWTAPCIGYCEAYYEQAKNICSKEWVLLTFPDEVWSKEALDKIKEIGNKPIEDICYAFQRVEYLNDVVVPIDHKNYQLRLMPKQYAKFCDLIHSSFMRPKKIMHLDLFFDHKKTREDQDVDEARFATVYKMLILRYKYSKIPWIKSFTDAYKKVLKDFADRGIIWND